MITEFRAHSGIGVYYLLLVQTTEHGVCSSYQPASQPASPLAQCIRYTRSTQSVVLSHTSTSTFATTNETNHCFSRQLERSRQTVRTVSFNQRSHIAAYAFAIAAAVLLLLAALAAFQEARAKQNMRFYQEDFCV